MRAGLMLVAFLLTVPVLPVSAQLEVDVNRPRSEFECDTPIGEKWYGSTARCLAELCAGKNVTNEWVFDAQNRRRRNPCYGQSPTEFGE
jgi:hypothetical protein